MPASNTKLLTFLMANRYLPSTIPNFKYQETPDSLFVWGVGDPSFLDPRFQNKALLDFMQAIKKTVILADADGQIPAFGSGWAWDDYNDDYSAEISSLPIYGNLVRLATKKGNWDFRLTPVYMIAILDFQYDENEERQKFLRSVNLKDQDGDVFNDKLTFKFIQMPLFVKGENELESHFDKWIYFLKKLESFDEIPKILDEPIFEKAFSVAELAKMTPQQYEQYEESLLTYIEVKEVVKTAEANGEKKKL
jgi:hypothetical protein